MIIQKFVKPTKFRWARLRENGKIFTGHMGVFKLPIFLAGCKIKISDNNGYRETKNILKSGHIGKVYCNKKHIGKYLSVELDDKDVFRYAKKRLSDSVHHSEIRNWDDDNE